ncbi:hypothetical protein [Calidifontibacillus oryziterrae]|uniref:hypothetical protein n=1 Tax=Calidifontibacillus oryziterrae TaxID=1191699 RepID=UPI0002DFCD91|nr:hypothetical protein [Calidifontibacillus oryziterrae]
MRIFSSYQTTNLNQYEQSTNQSKVSSKSVGSTTSTTSNQAAILDLSGSEQMDMEEYAPYTINSVKETYLLASTASLTPLEVYNNWYSGIGELVDERLNYSYAAIDTYNASPGDLTNVEFIAQLDQEQLEWFQQQYDNLVNQLMTDSSLTEEQAIAYSQQALEILGNMDLDMQAAIQQYNNNGEKVNGSFNGALIAYREFENTLGQEIANYLETEYQKINNSVSVITNDEIEDFSKRFNEWMIGLFNSFSTELEGAQTPNNTRMLLEENMLNTFEVVMPDIWNSISNTIQQKNSSIESANRRRQQAAEAEEFNRFKVDYKTGSPTNEINISTSKPTSNKYSTKFVVEGSGGKSKDVYISFSDERLKKEFDKRIKAAGLEGKKLSIKEFDEIMKELKKSLKELGDIDLEALLQKMEKGEKDLDFEHSMNRFILYLKRAVK